MSKFLFGGSKKKDEDLTFWGHLNQLRNYLIRSVLAILVLAIVAFFFRDFLFNTVILLPSNTEFITYRALCKIGTLINYDGLCLKQISLNLINIEIGGQFRYHLLISIIAGIVVAFPFIAWQLWLFVKPALKEAELKSARGFVGYISGLFLIGILFGYYIIAPLTINFLINYELSANIKNQITIGSYISMLSILTLSMGLVFELPVLVYGLTSIRILTSAFLRKYRRHAIVVIFILAGFITPSTDAFSQILVALPLYALFEISIFISKRVERNREPI
jgi:sec-independent protein translocase protein TatC